MCSEKMRRQIPGDVDRRVAACAVTRGPKYAGGHTHLAVTGQSGTAGATTTGQGDGIRGRSSTPAPARARRPPARPSESAAAGLCRPLRHSPASRPPLVPQTARVAIRYILYSCAIFHALFS